MNIVKNLCIGDGSEFIEYAEQIGAIGGEFQSLSDEEVSGMYNQIVNDSMSTPDEKYTALELLDVMVQNHTDYGLAHPILTLIHDAQYLCIKGEL